jgi:hypothetical protein
VYVAHGPRARNRLPLDDEVVVYLTLTGGPEPGGAVALRNASAGLPRVEPGGRMTGIAIGFARR